VHKALPVHEVQLDYLAHKVLQVLLVPREPLVRLEAQQVPRELPVPRVLPVPRDPQV